MRQNTTLIDRILTFFFFLKGNDGDDLMGAAKTLCTAFGELLTATEPNSTQPRQTMLSAASQVGSASHRVLYTIGEEEVADKDRQDVLLGLAKAVANTTAALVLKAKNVASKCPDQTTQNRVSFLIQKQLMLQIEKYRLN